jgi:hypothetical protein
MFLSSLLFSLSSPPFSSYIIRNIFDMNSMDNILFVLFDREKKRKQGRKNRNKNSILQKG